MCASGFCALSLYLLIVKHELVREILALFTIVFESMLSAQYQSCAWSVYFRCVCFTFNRWFFCCSVFISFPKEKKNCFSEPCKSIQWIPCAFCLCPVLSVLIVFHLPVILYAKRRRRRRKNFFLIYFKIDSNKL